MHQQNVRLNKVLADYGEAPLPGGCATHRLRRPQSARLLVWRLRRLLQASGKLRFPVAAPPTGSAGRGLRGRRLHSGLALPRTLPGLVAAILIASPGYVGCSSSNAGDGDGNGVNYDSTPGFGTTDTTGTETGPGEGGPWIETEVSADAVTAGESVAVTCVAYDADGEVVEDAETTWDTTPSDGADPAGSEGDGDDLTLTAAGTVEVTCASGDLVDGSPAVVEVAAGAPVRSVASVDPATVQAGGTSTVTCELEDEYGNGVEADDATVSVTPDGAAVDGHKISSTTVGEFEVSCTVAGADDLDVEAADWTVEMADIVDFSLKFTPDTATYAVNDSFQVVGVGVDAYGNSKDYAMTSLAAAPAGSEVVWGPDMDKLRFEAEGIYTVSAVAVDDASLTADKEAICDGSAPVIVIYTPERGFYADVETTVEVTGHVEDAVADIDAVEINGDVVAVDEDGDFAHVVPLGYAINTIAVTASDPWEHSVTVARSGIWSPSWYPLAPADFEGADRIGQAAILQLSQDGIDDGVHDPEELNDLATLLEVILAGIDLSTLLPDPLTTFDCSTVGGDCAVRMTQLEWAPPKVKLDLVPGGIMAEIDISGTVADPGFVMTIQLDVPCATQFLCDVFGDPVELPGTATVEGIELETTLFVEIVDGEIVVTASGTDLNLKGDMQILIDDITGGFINSILNFAIDFIEPGILAAIEIALPILLETQLSSLVGAFADALTLDQEIEIPPLFDGLAATTLRIQTEADAIEFQEEYMRLAMDGMAHAVDATSPYAMPGALKFLGCGKAGGPPVPPPAPMVVALHDDLINQLTYAIWQGRTLQIDLAGPEVAELLSIDSLPIDISALRVEPLLPLVMDGCAGDNRIAIGDLYVEAELDFLGTPTYIGMYVNGDAAVDVATIVNDEGATELTFDIQGLEELLFDVVINEGQFEGDDAGLIDLLGGQLLPLLLDQFLGDAGIALPAIDISSLAPGLPSAEINLDVQKLTRSGPYLVLEGGLK